MIRPDLTGIILAGGQSRRMGRNKAFLKVGGVPMILRVARALAAYCAEVLIVTKDPATYAHLGVPAVADRVTDQAPLVGACTGLRAASTPWAFVAACDLPYLSPAAIRLLADLGQGFDAAVPRVDGWWHPLHAVYATASAPLLEARLAAGERSITAALAALRVRAVGADELSRVDPALVTLRNVNTADDLGRASSRSTGIAPA